MNGEVGRGTPKVCGKDVARMLGGRDANLSTGVDKHGEGEGLCRGDANGTRAAARMGSWNRSLKRCGDVSGWASNAEEWGRLCEGVRTLNGRTGRCVC